MRPKEYRIKELLREKGLDGAIVSSPENFHYVTGFGGHQHTVSRQPGFTLAVMRADDKVPTHLTTMDFEAATFRIKAAGLNFVVDPKGGTLSQCGYFLQKKRGYKVKVFNSIDFSKSMQYNPIAYIKTESDILKFVNALIANTKGDGKEGDEFWTKAETLLYCALVAYIVFEGPEEERNMNTLVEMINSMEVREDDESFKNAVDYMFDGLAKRNPQHFTVRQYAKYKLASGDICSK